MSSLTELKINELFTDSEYIVPIYQRNYAWEQEQIEQLIQDIWDSCCEDCEQNYYLGSLVAFQREGQELFEVIDGQQRHTTLSILLSVLKNFYSHEIEKMKTINLSYDSRKQSKLTLGALYSGILLEEMEPSILNAYEICKRYLKNEVKEENIQYFFNYLIDKVIILKVLVPKETDLNHYFEVMNNRGEQLEKHEILKAQLMYKLNKEDDVELETFSCIWDSCADMNRYVQYGFPASKRKIIFGSDLNTLPSGFEAIYKTFEKGSNSSTLTSEESEELTLLDCIENLMSNSPDKNPKPKSKDNEKSDRFYSVINFSNYLLHAVRIYYSEKIKGDPAVDISLDDKKLLSIFSECDFDPKDFVFCLLKTRFLFDKYIIKREWDEKWSLKKLKIYERGIDNINYVNTWEEEESMIQKIIMLQSMIHVSFPSMIYKHWLTGILHYLYNSNKEIDLKEYCMFLENYCDNLFFRRFSKDPEEYVDIIFLPREELPELSLENLHRGTDTHNYIFNRLDYLIWKVNTEKQKLLSSEGFNLSKSTMNRFSFTFRSSVEHYFPQNPLRGKSLEKNDILTYGCDTFGNLCLISRSKNSKLSNNLPSAKKDYYSKSSITESLKQALMMEYKHWGPENTESILKHEESMINLISQKCSDL